MVGGEGGLTVTLLMQSVTLDARMQESLALAEAWGSTATKALANSAHFLCSGWDTVHQRIFFADTQGRHRVTRNESQMLTVVISFRDTSMAPRYSTMQPRNKPDVEHCSQTTRPTTISMLADGKKLTWGTAEKKETQQDDINPSHCVLWQAACCATVYDVFLNKKNLRFLHCMPKAFEVQKGTRGVTEKTETQLCNISRTVNPERAFFSHTSGNI